MKDENSTKGRNGLNGKSGAPDRLSLSVDVEKYQSLLDEANLTDAQKEQVLQALWSIIVSFVKLGFEVHPLQEVCGQYSMNCCQRDEEECDGVDSKRSKQNKTDGEADLIDGLKIE